MLGLVLGLGLGLGLGLVWFHAEVARVLTERNTTAGYFRLRARAPFH